MSLEEFKKYCKNMKAQEEVKNQGQPSATSVIYDHALKAIEYFENLKKERETGDKNR